jgi:hypothetical protein
VAGPRRALGLLAIGFQFERQLIGWNGSGEPQRDLSDDGL